MYWGSTSDYLVLTLRPDKAEIANNQEGKGGLAVAHSALRSDPVLKEDYLRSGEYAIPEFLMD